MTEERLIDCSVVIPVLDEEPNLSELYERLTRAIGSLNLTFEFVFVDDGSTDRTFPRLVDLNRQDTRVKVIRLSRNFGHQIALTAGIRYARGQAVITMDGDLQHPPELIPELIQKWHQGYEVVYTVRRETTGINPAKSLTSALFYRLIRWMTATNIPPAAPDFRLLDRRAVDCLNQLHEQARFIRGMVSWIGFSQISVDFVADSRHAGQGKYNFGKMFRFALDAIISFSGVPLRLSAYLGFLISLLAFLYGAYAVSAIIQGTDVVRGWSSTILVVLVLGGVQLISLGIIGEYLDRIYTEVKQRPLYVVRQTVGLNSQ